MTFFAFGQGKADKELNHYFDKQKLDTFLLVKIGCNSCYISYEDSFKNKDTLAIVLLYKRYGQITLVKFSDTAIIQKVDNVKQDIFDFIITKIDVLKQADIYYKEQKDLKFHAPCLTTYPYEKIQVQIGHFRHKHTVVKREMDDCGTNLRNEAWFTVEQEILAMVDSIKQLN